MLRLLSLLLLATLPLAPSAAQAQPVEDMRMLGSYPELAGAIATLKYHLVLKHPVVEQNLRELTGPHYARIVTLSNTSPIGYAPSAELILRGYTADTAQQPENLIERVMIVVDWRSGQVWAALRKPDATLVFAPRYYMNELPSALRLFIRQKAVDDASLDNAEDPPSEPWIRVFDYRDDPPQLWP